MAKIWFINPKKKKKPDVYIKKRHIVWIFLRSGFKQLNYKKTVAVIKLWDTDCTLYIKSRNWPFLAITFVCIKRTIFFFRCDNGILAIFSPRWSCPWPHLIQLPQEEESLPSLPMMKWIFVLKVPSTKQSEK